MNIKFCVACETESVGFGKTKITVGREKFEIDAYHCKKCHHVAITPKLQEKIDAWALQFTKSIVELQPYFTKDMLDRVSAIAESFSLSKSEFLKACATFYLLEMTKIANFKTIRSETLKKAKSQYQGPKDKICVPMKYQLFKKINLYARVWRLEYDANVLEEAVQFCVSILDHQSESAKELTHFVECYSMAS